MSTTNKTPITTHEPESTVNGFNSIDPPLFGKPNNLYSAITELRLSETASQYYISGQVAVDPRTNTTPHALSSQIDLCLERISICLDYVGAETINIVKLMYYIKDSAISNHSVTNGQEAGLSTLRDKLALWLRGHRPSSCLNRVTGLSDERYLFEIEAIVVVFDRKSR